MASAAPKSYPRQSEILRAMDVARKGGIDVGGVEIKPDGTIRVFDARTAPKDEFERWESAL